MNYRFHSDHPFNQERVRLTMDLLKHSGALSNTQMIGYSACPESFIEQVHTSAYIQAVKKASQQPSSNWLDYGIGTEDTPSFPEMHQASSFICGGSLIGADRVMNSQARALHLAGGLHHAHPGKASGFCIYNDAAVAIAYLRKQYDAKVLYIDTDVHHGDGVQWMFYSDPQVCTFSIHETGKYLFPGTGYVHERGEGQGFGFSVNLPLEPFTEDESWLECFSEVLERTAGFFKPDVIVSQHGCDAHALDPLSHMHCSMDIYLQMPKIIRSAADHWCNGRWLALGGGGYDIYRVVPRAWSMLWMVMSEHPMVQQVSSHAHLPQAWIEAVQPRSPHALPVSWLDAKSAWAPMPRRKEITENNRKTKQLSMMYL
ncbi:acetoin utilization protein AcuC [Marinicrinis lubricantis]|uniref:Acetoin utilization protein AcuC n=1 Tax=Marinicrinis lubricantis TaxID=2086470 RepID=A0ABW1IQI3_9BACL